MWFRTVRRCPQGVAAAPRMVQWARWCGRGCMLGTEVIVMSQRVVTVTEVLDGHVALDIQCPDRIYLNCYVPKLQTSAQVEHFCPITWAIRSPRRRCSESSVSASA